MGVPGSANFLLAGSQGYRIERSLRFNSADSAYLNRTPATLTNTTTNTFSAWVKRSGLAGTLTMWAAGLNSTNNAAFYFDSSDRINVAQNAGAGTTVYRTSTQVFRDPSAWYHFVLVLDTSNATAQNRIRVYVNNVEITTWTTNTTVSSGATFYWNSNLAVHAIGANYGATPSQYFPGYLTEINFIDGQALTPSSFGETDTITGVWKPKRYAGTYGNNGFYLNFSDNSGTTSTTLSKDSSGNGNNFTPNNFSVTAGAGNDSLIDTPTPYADGGNGRGNYCTLNPLTAASVLGSYTLSNGNLDITLSNSNRNAFGTVELPSTGKWYWEYQITTIAGGGQPMGGICAANVTDTSNSVLYRTVGDKLVDGTQTSYGASYTTTDIIGVAADSGAATVTFYKNGVSQGSISHTVAGLVPSIRSNVGGDVFTLNFGQRPFAYTPPSGFVALNTQNLPEPSIKKPGTYTDIKLYSGNGTSQTISGLGFSPDLVWIKERTSTSSHWLTDTVRGNNLILSSNSTGAELSGGSQCITAFNSDGFAVGNDSAFNESGQTYVAWCWDESATPGFDIVTYTGTGVARTVAHSLGVAPRMMIIKTRTSSTKNWAVYHAANGTPQNNVVYLNQTTGTNSSAGQWNSTAPTSSVFSVSGSPSSGYDDVNLNGDNYVAYLWSEVAGFSKFGGYTGNGSSDGPFLHCGFRPAFVIIKSSSSGYDWFMFDNRRDPENVVDLALFPNSSSAESGAGTYLFDFTSNGIKIRNSQLNLNGNGNTYIFCAWAEAPFKYALAR